MSRDPGAANYDPVTIKDIDDLQPRAIFEREPVSHAFSVIRAGTVREELQRRLPDGAVTIDCRTSSCDATIVVSAASLDKAIESVQIPPIADIMAPGVKCDSASCTIDLVMLFTRDHRDERTYIDALAKWREHAETSMRGVPSDGETSK